jgi:hypothetical protein
VRPTPVGTEKALTVRTEQLRLSPEVTARRWVSVVERRQTHLEIRQRRKRRSTASFPLEIVVVALAARVIKVREACWFEMMDWAKKPTQKKNEVRQIFSLIHG